MAKLYGGEAITPKQLVQWSDQMSTEELHARVHKVSASLSQYLTLAETGTDAEIEEDLAGIHTPVHVPLLPWLRARDRPRAASNLIIPSRPAHAAVTGG